MGREGVNSPDALMLACMVTWVELARGRKAESSRGGAGAVLLAVAGRAGWRELARACGRVECGR